MVEDKTSRFGGGWFEYPSNHKLGMKIPKGGSMCANCEYLGKNNTCLQKEFIKWNKSNIIPKPANEFCCDLYENK